MTIDAQILSALREMPDGVSGAELSGRLGITRAAIWARIEDLRACGYGIEASPHQGYRLVRCPDRLHADDLLSRLGSGTVIGRQVRVFQQTTSTNDVVEHLAQQEAKEGLVVFAESQSRGRGRLGRRWLSPAFKGLWFSVLLRPDLRPLQATQLTVAAATALVRAIREETAVEADVKWPNDVLIGGRKVAGILMEMNAELDHVKYLILGLGLDVNVNESDFPQALRATSTSLKLAAGKPVCRPALAARLLQELDRDYARICAGDFESVANEWAVHCQTLGREVSIQCGTREIRGWAESLDTDGALLVRSEHGHLERVVGGDVHLLPEGNRLP